MKVNTLNKIKDIEEFSKLFKINIPIKEHFDYYINSLSQSIQFLEINLLVKKFIELENYSQSLGYSSAKSYKLDFALPRLLKYITDSDVYNKIQEFELPKNVKMIYKNDLNKKNIEDFWYISFDISKANYSTFKLFDSSNDLKDSWEDLCFALDIHETLIKSKSFRQLVFGHLIPNKIQKIQHSHISNVISNIKLLGFSDDNIAFISHDEFILRFDKKDSHDIWLMKQYTSKEIISEFSSFANDLPISRSIFQIQKIGKEMYVKFIFDDNLEKKYNKLHAVPGNKFYKYFKVHVLKGDIDDRDLFFINDGDIAKWEINEDSIEEIYYPKGELSLEEVRRDYSDIFEELSNDIPNLTNSQKRKIVNIFIKNNLKK